MSKRVILHIGGEKTGTTTLQLFLARNSQQLQKAGYYYPSDRKKAYFGGYAHFPVAACLIKEEVDFISEEKRLTLPLVLDSLANDIKESDKAVILSCEHFSSRLHNREPIVKLRDAIGTEDTNIVCYIREPSDLALASWSTAIRYGCNQVFSTDEVTPDNPYFNYLHILDLWSSVFGEQNVCVREFNRRTLIDGDICRDFCELVGIDSQNMAPQEPANESLDAGKLEALKFINLALTCRAAPTWRFVRSSEEEDQRASQLRRQFEDPIDGCRRSHAIRDTVSQYVPAGKPLKSLMSDVERHAIRKRFESVNREINRRYLSGKMSSDWFASERELVELEAEINPGGGSDVAASLREIIIGLAAANLRLAETASTLAETDSRLAETQSRLAETQSRLAETQSRLAQYERQLQKVYSTKAWRARSSFMKLRNKILGC